MRQIKLFFPFWTMGLFAFRTDPTTLSMWYYAMGMKYKWECITYSKKIIFLLSQKKHGNEIFDQTIDFAAVRKENDEKEQP